MLSEKTNTFYGGIKYGSCDHYDRKLCAGSAAQRLKEVYEEIDKLEKTKLNVKEYSKRDEEYQWFALVAFLCVLLEVLLRNSILKKIP